MSQVSVLRIHCESCHEPINGAGVWDTAGESKEITKGWHVGCFLRPAVDPSHVSPPLAPTLNTAYATRRELHDAAKALLDNYTAGVASGDWGNWDAEAEPEVIRLRAALAECNR